MAERNLIGAFYMCAAMFTFSLQDGFSRWLANFYDPIVFVTARYWVFALFVVALSASRSGGLKAALKTRHIWLQIGRGLLLAAEIMVMMVAFVRLGLTESMAVFAIYPLLVA